MADKVTVQVYRDDWRALHRLQMEREKLTGRKPPLADIIREAVALLERTGMQEGEQHGTVGGR